MVSTSLTRRQELLPTPRDRNLIRTVLIVFSNSPNRFGQQLRGIKVFRGNRPEISSLMDSGFSTTASLSLWTTHYEPMQIHELHYGSLYLAVGTLTAVYRPCYSILEKRRILDKSLPLDVEVSCSTLSRSVCDQNQVVAGRWHRNSLSICIHIVRKPRVIFNISNLKCQNIGILFLFRDFSSKMGHEQIFKGIFFLG